MGQVGGNGPSGRRAAGSVAAILALLAAASATADVAGTPAEGTAEAGLSRPNILVIMMDDQRATGTLEVMPATRSWFADGGTTFTAGFANTPLCCPARSTTFSGRYQHNHGVNTNQDGGNLDQDATLQRWLHDAGYHTALAGKFLLHWQGPLPHFDHFAHTNGGYEDAYFNVDDADSHDLGVGQTRAAYSTDFVAERALDYLDHFEADDARPWFLYLAPQAPHGPFTPAPRHADAPVPEWTPTPGVTEDYTSAQKADKAPFLRDNRFPVEGAQADREGQLRTLLAADEMVDAVFRRLEANGELDTTLAVYTSDNGRFWAEHGMRSKSLPYTESVQVPFMVRGPAWFPVGTTDDRLAGLVDITPTVLAAAGVAPDPGSSIDGRSLLDPASRAELLLEYAEDPGFRYPAWASLRGPGWQYLEYYADDGVTVDYAEYYDLVADPYQLSNLLADADPANDPDVAALSARLAQARQCRGPNCP
ncbi:MAG: sulfatase [Actinomycetota bacterium]|nr:sulfatase [Actinomycetota bacterium]